MEVLKKTSVVNLIKKAVKAGTKNPTTDQLKVLSIALSDNESYTFLKGASVNDIAAIKTCISVVNGEAPKQVSDQLGTLFGLSGKETAIASEGQDKIYGVDKVEPTTEEQKDIRERNKNENKHPNTSDRKTEKESVAEPMKEKVDPKIKKVLDAGEKDPVEKRSSKKIAEVTDTRGLSFDDMVQDMYDAFVEEHRNNPNISTPLYEDFVETVKGNPFKVTLPDGTIKRFNWDQMKEAENFSKDNNGEFENYQNLLLYRTNKSKEDVSKQASKKTAGYYENELSSVLPIGNYPATVQIRSENGQTKWLNVNEEFFSSLESLKDQLLKNNSTEASKKTAGSSTISFTIEGADSKGIQKVINKAVPAMEKIVTDAFQGNAVLNFNGISEASKKIAELSEDLDDLADDSSSDKDKDRTVLECSVTNCINYDKEKTGNCKLESIMVNMNDKVELAICGSYATKDEDDDTPEFSEEDLGVYANRISKGESPRNVISSLISALTGKRRTKQSKKLFAEMTPGTQIQVNDQTTGQPMTLTVDNVSQMAGSSEPAIVAKDDAGNSVVVPSGTEITQVMETTV